MNLAPEIKYSFTKSSGAGGQHVNKVNTKVELRFNINESAILTEEQKETLLDYFAGRVSKVGEIILTSEKTRNQPKNKEIVTERFYRHIEKAFKKVPKRIPTRPTKTSKEKRLKKKQILSEKKAGRKKPDL